MLTRYFVNSQVAVILQTLQQMPLICSITSNNPILNLMTQLKYPWNSFSFVVNHPADLLYFPQKFPLFFFFHFVKQACILQTQRGPCIQRNHSVLKIAFSIINNTQLHWKVLMLGGKKNQRGLIIFDMLKQKGTQDLFWHFYLCLLHPCQRQEVGKLPLILFCFLLFYGLLKYYLPTMQLTNFNCII